MQTGQANHCVGLVDGAVGAGSLGVLGDPAAITERGLSCIPATGVNFRQLNHGTALQFRF